jgi:hypothetical protein
MSPKDTSFTFLSISPSTLKHLGLSIATIRAGGIGILDWTLVARQSDVAEQNLRTLGKLTEDCPGRLGIRIRADRPLPESFREFLPTASQWLILKDWEDTSESEYRLAALADLTPRILLEVTAIGQLSRLESWLGVSGIVARGHESGAWSSADSAFLLTQKLIESVDLPVYVQGGIGIHTAAACQAVGAAGVVLDDQLWLMPESPLSDDWQRQIANSNGQEALLIGEPLGWGCRVFARPGFEGVAQLKQLAEDIELEIDDPQERLKVWQQRAQTLLGWDESGKFVTCRIKWRKEPGYTSQTQGH